jgi:hypothetical protein
MRKPAAQTRLPFDLDADILELRCAIAADEAHQQAYKIGSYAWLEYSRHLCTLQVKLVPLVAQRKAGEEGTG